MSLHDKALSDEIDILPMDVLEANELSSDEPPDGGLKAWVTVAGASLTLFATFGYVYAFGVYQDFYARVYLSTYTPSQISWIGSFQLMMPFLLGVVAGKLHDEGYFHILVVSGSIIFTVSLFMVSLSTSFYQVFLSQGVGMGIGLGLLLVPTVSITSQHFKRRRALATGIVFAGTSCGAIVFPIMLNHLFTNPQYGFAKGIRASAYLALGCLFIGNILMRERKRSGAGKAPLPDPRRFLTDVPYMLCATSGGVACFALYFPVFYIQLFAVQHGLDENIAFYSLAILNAASAVGRIVGNYVVDYTGPLNILIPTTALSGGTIVAILGITSTPAVIVVSIFYGLFSGALLSCSIPLMANLSDTPDEIGVRTGLATTIQALANLGAAPIQGALLGSDYNWGRPVAFSATLVWVSSIMFCVAHFYVARRKGTQLV